MNHALTPGPWEVQEVGVGELFVVRPDGDGGSWGVCELSNDNAYADARLIAAAPDMYEALRHTMTYIEGVEGIGYSDIQIIREALKKATDARSGEPRG